MNWRDVGQAARKAEVEYAVQGWLIALLTLATALSAFLY